MLAKSIFTVFLLCTLLNKCLGEDVQGTPCACMEDEKPIGCGNIDCCAIQAEGATKSGIYVIHPYVNNRSQAVKVYCDMETDGGGWTVLQRREEVRGPFETFWRGFKDYQEGFGQLKYSHWLGLDHMNALTAANDQTVRFDLMDWLGVKKYAAYSQFRVNDKPKYVLEILGYSGTAGDATVQDTGNGVSFSTFDRDWDGADTVNCAAQNRENNGGFWYRKCGHVFLNAIYGKNGTGTGVIWDTFSLNLMRSEIKIRSKNFPGGCLKPTIKNI